jgi:hypothetical protein
VRALLLVGAFAAATWTYHNTAYAGRKPAKTAVAAAIFLVMGIVIFSAGHRSDSHLTDANKSAATSSTIPSKAIPPSPDEPEPLTRPEHKETSPASGRGPNIGIAGARNKTTIKNSRVNGFDLGTDLSSSKEATVEGTHVNEPKQPQMSQSCPQGNCIAGDNYGSPTVNNYGNRPDQPVPGVIPTITICYSTSLMPDEKNYVTNITFQTDTPITRPSYGFVFDGPVGDGDISIIGLSTMPYVNNLKLVGFEDRSYAFKIITTDFPNGSDVWTPGVILKAKIPSATKVKPTGMASFSGKEQKPSNSINSLAVHRLCNRSLFSLEITGSENDHNQRN